MITPSFARTMAAYNGVLNARVYKAAGRLSDTERKVDRGAFWHSIHGTLNHLLWADRMWMSRLDGSDKPAATLANSDRLHENFSSLRGERARIDAELSVWAAGVDQGRLDTPLTWFSAAAGRQLTAPCGFVVAHLFNHQTHHRGQVHAMLTAAGEQTGDTDLLLTVTMVA